MARFEDLPYRPCVGVVLINRDGLVFAGKRRGPAPEHVDGTHAWQMPQGGVDPGESEAAAARRELAEETGIVDAVPLGRVAEPLVYDWPPYHGPPHRLDRWRGQSQAWFAFRFTGAEATIDLSHAAPGEAPEFDCWRWEELHRLPALVVPYKRHVYARVAAEFAVFTRLSG